MQTRETYTDRQQFLTAILRRLAVTSLGEARSVPGELEAYSVGYLTGVIAARPDIYELVMEELASLGLEEPR